MTKNVHVCVALHACRLNDKGSHFFSTHTCVHARALLYGIRCEMRLLQLQSIRLLMLQLPSSMTIGILCPVAIGDGMPTGSDRSIGVEGALVCVGGATSRF